MNLITSEQLALARQRVASDPAARKIADGIFASAAPWLDRDAVVIYRDSRGDTRTVYFDPAYNETFALLHEDAHHDAMRLPLDGVKGVNVFVLTPIDLAVSKLSRFAAIDREDILALAKAGLISAKDLRRRAEEALPGYVGNLAGVRTAIGLACGDIEKPASK